MNEHPYFYIEILAPNGLKGIEKYLHECKLPLRVHESGFNRKTILKSIFNESDEIEWGMDSSTTDVMNASGIFFIDLDLAVLKLESLSLVLKKANFPHSIGLDNEYGKTVYEQKYEW